VKNNLQIVSSLLYLQEDYMEDTQGMEILRDSQNRVKSMALIHEQLYGNTDLASIDFGGYVEDLTANLREAYGIDPLRIQFDIQADQIALGVDMAVPCGLIINELVSNALKHAFGHDADGRIEIAIRHLPLGQMEISVADNGAGLPSVPVRERQSLGLRLIDTLVTQLDGSLTVDTTNGTQFRIKLNLPDK
jgi:two-component sensor histidine kinase